MSKYKTVKEINPKYFTECLSDKEVVGYIGHERPDITKVIEEAIEKMIKEDGEVVGYIDVVRPNEPDIVIERIEVKKDEI